MFVIVCVIVRMKPTALQPAPLFVPAEFFGGNESFFFCFFYNTVTCDLEEREAAAVWHHAPSGYTI